MDLLELEGMLIARGVGSPDHLEKAKAECSDLGLFVRSMIGLDRETAKQALSGFLSGKTLTSNQIEFVDLIVNHLKEHGVMQPAFERTELAFAFELVDVSRHAEDRLLNNILCLGLCQAGLERNRLDRPPVGIEEPPPALLIVPVL